MRQRNLALTYIITIATAKTTDYQKAGGWAGIAPMAVTFR